MLHSANTSNVDTVIVDGKVLKFNGKILSVNVDDVRREAMESFYLLRERAGGAVGAETLGKAPSLNSAIRLVLCRNQLSRSGIVVSDCQGSSDFLGRVLIN